MLKNIKKIIVLTVAASMLLITSCVPSDAPLKPKFTKSTYPAVDGSTATIPLSENLAAHLLSMSSEEAKEFIKHNTTHSAYIRLLQKEADIIFVTEPSKDELAMAEAEGIELEVIPVVKEAFVFLVNKDNPVDDISAENIKNIYQGKIQNWNELGGPDLEIIAYQRPVNSGSQTLMQSIVMKELPLADAPTELRPSAMMGLIEFVASYSNSKQAIGYSVYYFANSMYNKDTVRFVNVDGVEPNNDNISNDKYPFSSAYYAVLRKDEPKNSDARKLLDFLLSEEGQKLATDSGYVPLRQVEDEK